VHPFAGTSNHGPSVVDDDGSLHQAGVCQQECHNVVFFDVVSFAQPEFREVAVFADEIGCRLIEHVDEQSQRCLVSGCVQVFGDVELDVESLENFEDSARLTSAGVVEDVDHLEENTPAILWQTPPVTDRPREANSSAQRGPTTLTERITAGAILVAAFFALFWAVEIVDAVVLDDRLQRNGISPRRIDGLDGVLWSPFLHGSFNHLVANTLPFLVLGSMVMIHGRRVWWQTTVTVVMVGGLATWLFARTGNHIGASGLVFGYLGFLVGAAFWNRSVKSILLALVALVFYGGMIWGFVPRSGVSWEGHLFGAIAGVGAAWVVFRSGWLRDAGGVGGSRGARTSQ
jgi:membrane associated rhomboid family serine protease